MKVKRGGYIHILKHSVNLGKGRALKTAYNYYLGNFPESVGVVECDADGQHLTKDIVKCADMLLQHKDGLVLGVRDFDTAGIPFRSRFGNKCTGSVFKFFCGINIKDTQTGLKGIPYEFLEFLIQTPGERYEYETGVLLELKQRDIPIYQFDIQTVYLDGNETSHFNPLKDSLKIYSVILRYVCSSLLGMLVDYAVFLGISAAGGNVFIATYAGRLLSAVCNFTVNKKFVFRKKGNSVSEAVKYMVLLCVSGTLSAFVVSWLHTALNWNLLLSKMLIETVLFFFNFYVQNNFVFKHENKI